MSSSSPCLNVLSALPPLPSFQPDLSLASSHIPLTSSSPKHLSFLSFLSPDFILVTSCYLQLPPHTAKQNTHTAFRQADASQTQQPCSPLVGPPPACGDRLLNHYTTSHLPPPEALRNSGKATCHRIVKKKIIQGDFFLVVLEHEGTIISQTRRGTLILEGFDVKIPS